MAKLVLFCFERETSFRKGRCLQGGGVECRGHVSRAKGGDYDKRRENIPALGERFKDSRKAAHVGGKKGGV